MTDETEQAGTESPSPTPETPQPEEQPNTPAKESAYYTAFPRFPRHTSHETGEGSLLNRTVELVDRLGKPSIELLVVENGVENPVPLSISHENGVSVIPPETFDAYRSKPLYRSGTAELGSVDSLIAYTNRYKGSGTVLFADDDRNDPGITAVFDYHEAGDVAGGGQRFGRHRASHALPLSDEWKAWASLNGKAITMPNFARFLEDRIVDVLGQGEISLSPMQQKFVDALGGIDGIADPAKLLELATGLRVFESAQVSQAVNLSSGEGEVIFTSSHTDQQGGKLRIPRTFVIAIPVFRHGDLYQIVVRLRYRKEGGISFIYELWRDDMVFDHAFDEAVDKAASGTSLPSFRGAPSI